MQRLAPSLMPATRYVSTDWSIHHSLRPLGFGFWRSIEFVEYKEFKESKEFKGSKEFKKSKEFKEPKIQRI